MEEGDAFMLPWKMKGPGGPRNVGRLSKLEKMRTRLLRSPARNTVLPTPGLQ